MDNDYSKEIREISEYLENKYNEKFTVARLVSDDGEVIVMNKAYVFPEEKEADWFAVRMGRDSDTETREFRDGYAFVFVAQSIFPAYCALIMKTIPDAKITVGIENEFEVTRVEHQKGVSFEKFTEKESPFSININIFISDDTLKDRKDVLEKLSRSINDTPGRGLYYEFKIMFVKAALFADFHMELCRGFSLSEYEMSVKEVVAHTHLELTEDLEQSEINEILNRNFIDISNFNVEDLIIGLGGEEFE